jgi:hypothetical protein
MSKLSIALVHHPVLDRAGATVTTAITNLDLHDMARSARTYGVEDLYVVHPIQAQRDLADRIKSHWVDGSGKKRIPDRASAMDVLRVVPSLDDVYAALGGALATYAEARAQLEAETRPVLILFGTGWGLTRPLVDSADLRIEPIHARAPSTFNHLSVRAACAITLDRLLG